MTVGHAAMHGDHSLRNIARSRELGSPTYVATELEQPQAPTINLQHFGDIAFHVALEKTRELLLTPSERVIRRGEWPPRPEFDHEYQNGIIFSSEYALEWWS